MPCGADCLNGPYGYLEASVSIEGAACPLEVDALIAAAALASKDWPIGLLSPPIKCLTPGDKSPECSKGFPQSSGSKSQKRNE